MKRKILGAVSLVLILALLATGVCASAWWDPLAVERQIYTYLTEELKLNSAAACGILANIEYESAFQVTIVGDQGTSYGLCQWHDGRYTALRSFCAARGLDYRTVEGQLAYLAYELKSTYNGLYGALRSVDNSADGAYRAAYLWCVQYEKPADMEEKAVTRGNSAKYKYWNRYNSLSMIVAEESAPEPEEIIEELTDEQNPAIELPRQAYWVEETEEGRRCVVEKPEKLCYTSRHTPPEEEPVYNTACGVAVGLLFLVTDDGLNHKYRLPLPEESDEEPEEEPETEPENEPEKAPEDDPLDLAALKALLQ